MLKVDGGKGCRVVGLAAPVVLSSRADPPSARIAALALAFVGLVQGAGVSTAYPPPDGHSDAGDDSSPLRRAAARGAITER